MNELTYVDMIINLFEIIIMLIIKYVIQKGTRRKIQRKKSVKHTQFYKVIAWHQFGDPNHI
jgi:hypothetical protein